MCEQSECEIDGQKYQCCYNEACYGLDEPALECCNKETCEDIHTPKKFKNLANYLGMKDGMSASLVSQVLKCRTNITK